MSRKDCIDLLVKTIEGLNYGDTLNYEAIARLIGEDYGTKRFSDIVQAARRRLVNCGKMIECVQRVGYKVVEPDAYANHGIKQVMIGARRIDTGARIMTHAPVNDMSEVAREHHNRITDKMRNLQAAMAGASVEINMLNQPRVHPLLNSKRYD